MAKLGRQNPPGGGPEDLLRSGIAAARAGHDGWARELLRRAVELDPENLRAWLWLSDVAEDADEKLRCQEQVLRLEPAHDMARRGLSRQHEYVAPMPAEIRPAWPAPEQPAVPHPALEPDLDDLLQAGIRAASARRADVARDLLGRVIQVDEKHMAAWLWLSYVADTSQERDRCVNHFLGLAGVDAKPRPEPVLTYQAAPAAGAAVAAALPAPGLGQPLVSLAPDAVATYDRLRAAVGGWASAWTITAQVYLAGILAAELLTTYAQASLGLLAHSLLLVALLVHASRVRSKAQRAFLVSMAFAPLIRILSLSLPLAEIPLIYWYLITSVPLFAALIVAARTLGFSWSSLGLHLRGWPLQLAIGLTGLAFGAVEYWILEPEPLAQGLEWGYLWRPALIMMVSTGLLEEMIFRGLLQRTSTRTMGRWGLLYVALLFAVLHIGYQLFVDVVFVFFVGLFFAWIVQRTRSLLGVTISHGLTNVMLFLVMPFLMA